MTYEEFLEFVPAKGGLLPAQQEPVALVISGVLVKSKFPENYTGHLYTTPPQRTWVGLTDREKSNLWLESRAAIPRFHTYASLVEAKLREKNQFKELNA